MIDIVNLQLKAGNGGNGAVAFRREKYEPSGGPAGGDGGDGGSIYIIASSEITTLADYRYKKKYFAQNGTDGQKKNRFGNKGESLYLKVPVGTIIREEESNKIIKDLKTNGQTFLIARGGKGGKGNARYKNSVRQAPRFAQPGQKGQEINIILELKMLADVALVGLPNVGKSTLISVISKAKPKIANYHFTTLDPNLGVVEVDEDRSFVVADIPGLIEGASEGIGLGHDFLKHIERCRILLHLIDISASEGRDPIEDYKLIKNELTRYGNKLDKKKEIIVLNKKDLDFNDNAKKFKEEFDDKIIFEISAITTSGVKQLINKVTEILSTTKIESFEFEEDEDFLEEYYNSKEIYDLNFKLSDDKYHVYGKRIDNLLERVNFEDYDSRMFFEMKLKEMGIFDKFREMGIQDGDIMVVGDLEFEYYE
ncbi:MAG: GTPase ObgE [Tissierellia bacterium]|nr:GTPase ObgE [Tissierellia bacterium]